MKITASKDFGSNKKLLLPLVVEPTEATKKEDLAQVDLFSNPSDANSTKVRFTFRILEGAGENPREVITWRRNVEHAFVGLNQTDEGFQQHQMVQQFCRGTALAGYNTEVQTLYSTAKENDVNAAQRALDNDDGTNAA